MGGFDTKELQRISALERGQAETQAARAERLFGFSEADRARWQELLGKGLELFAPGIEFYKGIATGDRATRAAAAAPITSEIGRQGALARERIYTEVPRGAGQEFALATVPREQAAAVARAMGETYISSFDKLGGYGQELVNVARGVSEQALAETAAGLRGSEAASTSLRGAGMTQQALAEAQAAKKQATMGFLGSIVQAAGTAAGGGVFGKLSDRRLKRNIRPFSHGPEAIVRMEPMAFEFTGDGGTVNGEPGVSVIAQELAEILPEAVTQGKDGYLRIKTDYILWALVNAVKELLAREGPDGR